MNLNIFKRVTELENEVAALRGLLYEHLEILRNHITKQEATTHVKTRAKTKEEQRARRQRYAKEYHQRKKATETPEQIAKRKAYSKAYYQKRKEQYQRLFARKE